MGVEEGGEPELRTSDEPYWEPDEFEYEELERYCDGGFCPVSVWQKFHHGRYRIAYKLGYGHFSTVWLAQDLQKQGYVALKFLAADQFGQCAEVDMLRAIASSDGSSSGPNKYLTSLLDSFDYESANGKHHVLALPLSRPLIGLRPLNMDLRTVAKDLVLGLDHLHAAGIVHGDIHTSNVGYQMQGFSDEQLKEMVPPQSHIVPPLGERRPPYLVSRQEWSTETILDRGYHGPRIPQIFDFGSAFKISEKKDRTCKSVAVPQLYQPPEHIFNTSSSRPMNGVNYGELNKRTDVWALGATIFELAAGQTLVRQRWGSSPETPYLQIDDRIPHEWQEQAKAAQERDSLSKDAVAKFWKESFDTIQGGPVFIGDKQLFKRFILDMVCLDPEIRLGTQALLKHEYIADVPQPQ